MPTVPATGGADVVAETVLQRVKEEFEKVEGGKVLKNQVGPIVKALGLPLYWKCPFFNFTGGDKMGHVTLQAGLAAWKKLVSNCHDESSRFLRLVAKPGRQFVEFDDFLPLIQDVVDTHPGLTFLQDAPEFHSRYVQTVISRIFYTVNRSWSSRITLPEIRKSNFLETVRRLEVEDDINQITDYFSYEHFYVIYCKFWELDKDHDLLISKEDLSRHNDHAISSRIIDRIFSGAVTRNLVDGKLCYKDFVWFLMSEEDKRNPRSIEYWFRCMDLDGDGIISMYEMEYFYEEQVEKMEMLGIETLPFQDCLCQMLDMVRPKEEGKIRLKDLKACSLTPIYFDTFINLDKYLEHEQKDPFASLRDQDSDEPEPSDWERYAAEEYELLVAEEGTAEVQQDAVYEDELEPDLSTTEGSTQPTTKKTSSSTVSSTSQGRSAAATKNDDIYDFSNTDVGY
jgi:serine/threonine-protein phosphatase 2A regulatory subunit B''